MDTSNDSRVLVAEKCVQNLHNLTGNLKNVKKSGILKDLSAKIMELKYSFGEIEDILPIIGEIKRMTEKLFTDIGGSNWVNELRNMRFDEEKISRIRFCLNILYNLDSRMKLPPDPAYAVDIRVGKVESVMKHPNAEKLKLCNVNVGKVITVITNLQTVKEGMKLPVALLPPAKLRGIVSEGMFLSDKEKMQKIGEIPELSEEELNNARKEILAYLRSK